MRQGQQRWHMAIGIAGIAPGIDVGRRHDDGGIAFVLEPIDQLERRLLQARQRELVIVVFVPVVPRRNARDAVVETPGEHDDAAAIEVGDVGRSARMSRVRRILLHERPIGDADEIRSELARFGLDAGGRQRALEYRDHAHSLPLPLLWSSLSARASLRRF